ncbi:hypothetical protein C7974DRAFT_448560 [Boeremia exigua]|uniref:uncharacterized protein n=1 Tax=Boeremia exigua TaxID=749465 RepID=UPI001E8EC65E|nr:uncharacterized protein C7974DRAFT_448560 [Boeremia exigua]KAH6638817.1 hypothetical protein C7974DRAFT_448560 [Boeremia exigua]
MRAFSKFAICALPLLSLVAAQQPILPPCRQKFTTNIWTSCADVVSQFQLSVANFLYANPQLGAGCSGFKPGETYCVSRPSNQRPISMDGNCGIQNRTAATCVGSSFGSCCNASGRCGNGESFCGKGNCQDGLCDGGRYSLDGKCGRDFDYLPCPPKFGLCCGGNGQCGNATAFCTTPGCQSGPCLGASSTVSSSATPTPTMKPGGVSPDGTCGYNKAFTCKSSTFGGCCSAAGYCGNTEYECSSYLGCQSKFGQCT